MAGELLVTSTVATGCARYTNTIPQFASCEPYTWPLRPAAGGERSGGCKRRLWSHLHVWSHHGTPEWLLASFCGTPPCFHSHPPLNSTSTLMCLLPALVDGSRTTNLNLTSFEWMSICEFPGTNLLKRWSSLCAIFVMYDLDR
ncbi:hypothetical protein VPH35_089110 [Triticum aestivum]